MGTSSKELLIELTRHGITLQVADGQIQYSAPEGAFTSEMRSNLSRCKLEILSLYSGSQIPDTLARIADIWDVEIESRGEGDAAWAWIKASAHWPIISAAEDEVDLIGSRGNPDKLNAACREWMAAWVEAIAAWRDRGHDIGQAKIVQPRAFCEGKSEFAD